MRTLCQGYAEVGAKPVSGCSSPETRGSASIDFVECPMDVTMKYFYRAEKQVAKIPHDRALEWLVNRDEGEREAWVELYRATRLTLGQVIQRLHIGRESLWIGDKERKRSAPALYASNYDHQDERRATLRPAAKDSGRTIAMTKDHRQICSAWNRGECHDPYPKNFLHFCSREVKGDRACGMTNHRADQCKNPKRIGNP